MTDIKGVGAPENGRVDAYFESRLGKENGVQTAWAAFGTLDQKIALCETPGVNRHLAAPKRNYMGTVDNSIVRWHRFLHFSEGWLNKRLSP